MDMPSSSWLSALTQRALGAYSRIAPTERGGYRLVRLGRRFIPRPQWQAAFRTPDGITLDLDLAVYPDCCMAFGLYELDSVRIIRKILQPGDHFIDIGGNIGYITLLAAQRVGPTGRIDVFEPQPDNLARLRQNLAHNGNPACVHVHPLALLDRADTVRIHYFLDSNSNHGASSIFAGAQDQTRWTLVPGDRLDHVLPDARPRLIKIDVEGAEPLVIEGMRALLTGPQPPMILMEYNPDKAKTAGFPAREALDRLLAMQPAYRVHNVAWRLQPLKPTDANLARLRQGNLLFVPPPNVV